MPRTANPDKNMLIKRTVVINKKLDQAVRNLWSKMILANIPDPTYSHALNTMLLYSCFIAANGIIDSWEMCKPYMTDRILPEDIDTDINEFVDGLWNA